MKALKPTLRYSISQYLDFTGFLQKRFKVKFVFVVISRYNCRFLEGDWGFFV